VKSDAGLPSGPPDVQGKLQTTQGCLIRRKRIAEFKDCRIHRRESFTTKALYGSLANISLTHRAVSIRWTSGGVPRSLLQMYYGTLRLMLHYLWLVAEILISTREKDAVRKYTDCCRLLLTNPITRPLKNYEYCHFDQREKS
jgi:hypothetical protein